jgi:hypothetical protein
MADSTRVQPPAASGTPPYQRWLPPLSETCQQYVLGVEP